MEALSENFGWIEIVFTALVAFGFGGYQLWSVNREIERDKQKKREADSSVGSGHTIGEHELDDR
ncbi:hypothetical protein [Erythrobacter sp.]|uniref:hypothetical protein n=1 Tax=Erythrobacter sp. TaxID=1042 RepID=UPI001B203ECD|nr:hypothetical protein [Erythrobacter sp.]MBO6527126.1 hypothetical protein [Erythrobacter sp.]MBO6529006.1 hypothetical protein [Erythrobacter sp.]